MGDLESRRSTLVSRLPIFRRSIGRRQDSLPSSPSSSNTVGLHSSSPSSTNSSSGSTGKRRSIFRTTSLSFHQRKENNQKTDSVNQTVNISNESQSSHSCLPKLDVEEQVKNKGKSSISVYGSRRKKITRSVTEDFEKKKDHSVNRNVFTNCLGKNESDDSGFIEEESKRSVKHSTRKLLPRSLSSHYRFSRPVSRCQSPSLTQNSGCSTEHQHSSVTESPAAKPLLPSAAEITENTEGSLHSPLISTDHTTAPHSPSDFTFMDDSASEADSLPNSGQQQPHKQHICHANSTSPTFRSPGIMNEHIKETDILKNGSHVDGISLTKLKDETSMERLSSKPSVTSPSVYQPKVLLPISELSTNEFKDNGNNTAGCHTGTSVFQNGGHSLSTENVPKKYERAADIHEMIPTKLRTHRSVSESKSISSVETPSALTHHNHARVNYANSFSPYRDWRSSERRSRSSSEGTAGGSRMAFRPKDGNTEESNSLRKQRTNSTSSKMNSM
ncbi:hypothetical protein XELAEV_180094631mg, partial [Xenopus laevis]